MRLNCFLRDEQLLCNIAISRTRRDMAQNLHLTFAESLVAEMLRKCGGNFRWNALLAGVNLANRLEHLFWRHTLQQVSTGPRFQCPLHLHIALECRKDDDARVGKLRPDGYYHVEAADVRETEVHQGNVGSQRAKCFNPFSAVRGSPRQRHVGLRVDDRGDTLPNQCVVVDAQDSDAIGVHHICPPSFPTHRDHGLSAFAASTGTATRTAVPTPGLLQISNRASIFSARARIPRSPQCESLSF